VTTATGARRYRAGWLVAALVAGTYTVLGLSVDVPDAKHGLWSDEATYLLMGHSLAADGDLEYRHEDLERVLAEYPTGPSGVFLKRGTDVTGVGLTLRPPFVEFRGVPDPDRTRLYYGKSFVYPLVAAPFVFVFGTNGFLVLNALLLGTAVLAAYVFLRARSSSAIAVMLSTAFVLATVVPVYAVWLQPEVFNFALGLVAHFCWLYKFVAPQAVSRRTAWLRTPASDIVAGALIGVVTFSKVTNALLMVPIGAWWLWRLDWRRLVLTSAAWFIVTAGFFGANVAISGEWNYQGGDRSTCYADTGYFPLQEPGRGLEECDARGRDVAMTDVIFDPEVFWPMFRANLGYFFVGRNAGLVAYFFPAVFGIAALLLARGRRETWQWFVLAGLTAQILFVIVTLPYTYFGGGGSVGNRYFMGVYGMCLFLLPPIRSRVVATVPWVVGAVLMGALVLHPFRATYGAGSHTKAATLRWLPVELTNFNDLPIMQERARHVQWFGDRPGVGDLGFQVVFLDDHAYGRESETDKAFWVRGASRTEVLIRTDRPVRFLSLNLTAGARPTVVTVRVEGRARTVELQPGRQADVIFDLPPGFPYKNQRPVDSPGPSYLWVVSIESTGGFVPAEVDPTSRDTRSLGVRVEPAVMQGLISRRPRSSDRPVWVSSPGERPDAVGGRGRSAEARTTHRVDDAAADREEHDDGRADEGQSQG